MSFSFYGLYHRTEDPPMSLLLLTAAHVVSFLAFTTWVWATAPTFECANFVHLVVFGHWVRVTGWIRYIVLSILGFWNVEAVFAFSLVIPSALTEIPFLVEVSPFLRAFAIYSGNYGDDVPVMERVLIGAFAGLGFLLFGIIMAELMIATHHVVQQDGEWGFGQVAAMILLLTPVFNLVRVLRDHHIKRSTMSVEQRPLATLRRLVKDLLRRPRQKADVDVETVKDDVSRLSEDRSIPENTTIRDANTSALRMLQLRRQSTPSVDSHDGLTSEPELTTTNTPTAP
ncbi:hypothetical protein EIP91_005521 [Steccherinum ochraceum]|uniref:Transmembrane protein n=1 Tax=Steccherinum ochraceum TaxID=92696 RepID=A0A4R0RXL1_9APHY|nr:hypothetical protein EIP91_005521 [Steccherinum ochraceum]